LEASRVGANSVLTLLSTAAANLAALYEQFCSVASPVLIACAIAHCPVQQDTIISDDATIDKYLSYSPIALTRSALASYYYLQMPLVLLQACALSTSRHPLSAAIIALFNDGVYSDVKKKAGAFEEFVAKFLVCLRLALQLLPASVRCHALSAHYPSAVFTADAGSVTFMPASSTSKSPTVVSSLQRFPASRTLTHHDSKMDLRKAFTDGECVVVNASGATFADVMVVLPGCRCWLQIKGFEQSAVKAKMVVTELGTVSTSLGDARDVLCDGMSDEARAVYAEQRDLFVLISQGRCETGFVTALIASGIPTAVIGAGGAGVAAPFNASDAAATSVISTAVVDADDTGIAALSASDVAATSLAAATSFTPIIVVGASGTGVAALFNASDAAATSGIPAVVVGANDTGVAAALSASDTAAASVIPVIVVGAGGAGVAALSASDASATSVIPAVVICAGHGFDEFFGCVSSIAALVTSGTNSTLSKHICRFGNKLRVPC
jgi:hypothetical protein